MNIIAIFRLVRVNNLLIVVLMQYLTAIFLTQKGLIQFNLFLDFKQFLLVFSTVCIAAAGYIINDYFDIKIDQYNKPEKVIVGRSIRRRNAILFHQTLNLIGVLIGFYLKFSIGIINVLAVFLLWFYAERFKRMAFIGNFLVATMTFLSVFIVGVFYEKGRRVILIYALFAFVFTLIREIIKDLEDIRGDARYGCRTLPIVWGIRKTKYFIYVLTGIFILQLFVLAIPIESIFIKIIFGLFLIPISYMIFVLFKADKKSDFAWLSKFCKTIMIFGILSMCFYNF